MKLDLRVANAMLATTSYLTRGVKDFKAPRYDLELKEYEGILDWINTFRPNPNGKLYIKDHRIVLPGKERGSLRARSSLASSPVLGTTVTEDNAGSTGHSTQTSRLRRRTWPARAAILCARHGCDPLSTSDCQVMPFPRSLSTASAATLDPNMPVSNAPQQRAQRRWSVIPPSHPFRHVLLMHLKWNVGLIYVETRGWRIRGCGPLTSLSASSSFLHSPQDLAALPRYAW